MSSLLQELLGNVLSGEGVEALAKKSGADADTIKNIANDGLPVLLQSIMGNAKDGASVASLGKALSDHAAKDASPLTQIAEADTTDGKKIIGHLLGNKTETVEADLAKKAGASTDIVSTVLASLAPMVMSQVGKSVSSSTGFSDSDNNDLSSLLKNVMKDGDGDGTPDVIKGLMGLFKK
ncbi:hypothetical protein M2145_001292 [Lachnospiraceae bacterium PF1-21]|uniref:DUF937 domain-containing protein n=1 Tax=Ohessyouella blattaphilus TaxID=2949333 RepID=UPI003E24D278